MSERKRVEKVNMTIQAAWHIAGGGILPDLHHAIAKWLITQVGETVSMILALFQLGHDIKRRDDENKSIEYIDVLFPVKPEKIENGAVAITSGGRKLLFRTNGGEAYPEARSACKFSNTYNVVGVEEYRGRVCMRVRLYESGYDIVERIDVQPVLLFVNQTFYISVLTEKHDVQKRKSVTNSSQNFAAVLETYLDFNWSRIPKTVKRPAIKQAAEQWLSAVGLLREGDQKNSHPSTEERDPEGRILEWQEAVRAIARRTKPFEYKTARELDPRKFDEDDPRGDRLVNVSEGFEKFTTSPFPRRMSLKLTPETSIVYRRIWKDAKGETQNRLWITIPVFKGLGPDDANRKRLSHPKLWWWHKHLSEFTPMPLWWEQLGKKSLLGRDYDTIVIPLQYDRQKDGSSIFERTLCNADAWEICLSTLCERSARNGARSFEGNTLHRFPTYFRSDLAVGFDMPEATMPTRILGIHFSDTPVITWVLGDILNGESRVIESGSIRGNEILDAGLEAQVRLEEEAGKLRWTGGKQFKGVIAERTNALSNTIVQLAISRDAHIALEEIKWVDKRKGGPDLNKRFSMWNYASLTKRIQWLGIEIGKRPGYERLSAPVCGYVSDYITNMTCPTCGAIRKMGEKKEIATTWCEEEVLNCRNCGHSAAQDDMFKAHIVFLETAKRIIARAKQ